MLGKGDSNIWHQALAKLPPLQAEEAGGQSVDPDLYEQRRVAAEKLMESEAAAFEKELSKRNPTDSNWLQQVRRAGTSADKLAAATLLVQVRARVRGRGEGRRHRGCSIPGGLPWAVRVGFWLWDGGSFGRTTGGCAGLAVVARLGCTVRLGGAELAHRSLQLQQHMHLRTHSQADSPNGALNRLD